MIKEEARFADSSVMEGMVSFRAVINGIDSGVSDRKILKVLVDETRAKKHSKELSYVKAMSFKHGFEIENVSPDVIDGMTVGSSHGGIIAICSARNIPRLSASAVRDNGFYVLADGIEDPYNFGYALRSLYAAGAHGVILTPRNWMSAAGVVCRASAGASEEIPMFVCEPEEAAEIFKSRGYKIVCAEMKDSVPMYDADLGMPILAIIGGERRGISSDLLEKADARVRIDYGRDFSAALSAASAATVLAFEIFRQNNR